MEMGIAGITMSSRMKSAAAGKATSGKGWKLSDSLQDKIVEYAREDAAQNVYMGNKFLALRRSEVAKVAPDRAALKAKIGQVMGSGNMADLKKIREADERWLCLLFGEPYEAEFQSGGMGSAVHVYDGNGDEILTYTAGVGWQEKESKAETEVHGVLKAVYYDAFRAARREINAGMDSWKTKTCLLEISEERKVLLKGNIDSDSAGFDEIKVDAINELVTYTKTGETVSAEQSASLSVSV